MSGSQAQDEQFASERVRLAQLTNKPRTQMLSGDRDALAGNPRCTDDDLDFYIRQASLGLGWKAGQKGYEEPHGLIFLRGIST